MITQHTYGVVGTLRRKPVYFANRRQLPLYRTQYKQGECSAIQYPLLIENMTYFGGWKFQNKNIFVFDLEMHKHFFSPAIKVTKKLKDICTGAYFLEIKFYANSHVESVVLERKLLGEKFLPCLLEKGFWLSSTLVNEVTLSEILMEQENSVSLGLCHSKLGYQLWQGKVYYFGKDEIAGNLDSTYVGDQELSVSGAFCEWQAFVKQAVEANPLLALPMAMGASAPIATRLKQTGDTDETLLWALIGASSTGKTTCLKLSASAWGKPSGEGIIDNLTGTEKYFFASLASREGYPNFFDETSAVTWDFSKAIYTVALSREGGRCNPDGTPKKRKTWSGAVIFTGETSMFHRTNGNGGLHARLVEFDFSWFAEDESQPEKISRFVSQNYGTAWQQFMCYMQTMTDVELCEKYDATFDEIRKAIAVQGGFDEETWMTKKFTGIQKRIIKKLAVLLVAIDLMAVAWDWSVDHLRVIEYLLSVYEHNASRIDKIDEFREALVQHIARHRNEFPAVNRTGFDSSSQSNAKGFQDRWKGRNCVWILANEFEMQLLKHGLDASPNVLHELHRRKMIEHFGDRFRKNYKTGAIKPLCFCFYPDTEPPPPASAKKKKSKKKGSQLKNLLEEN